MSAFSEWQPRYAALGIPTFPVRNKRPAVRGYSQIGLGASRLIADKFPFEDTFGLACKRNFITVLDVDTPDERILTDALSEFGPTPFIVRSGSGNWQAWYRHSGERRLVRPDPNRPIDILGDGFVVAPPSRSTKGSYSLVSGTLDDLARLPAMRRVEPKPLAITTPAPRAMIGAGRRNDQLWRSCMKLAPECRDVSELMGKAAEANQTMFYEPLPDKEVLRIVASAWAKESSGENWFGCGGRVILSTTQIDEIGRQHPDAFILLAILKRHHWGARQFVIANAMADSVGQTRKRFAAARRYLETVGEIEQVRPASKQNGAAIYKFKGGRN